MGRIVLVTDNEALRASVAGILLEAGHGVSFGSTWSHAVEGLARPATALLLVDVRVDGVAEHADTLLALAASLSHKPALKALVDTLPGMETVSVHPTALRAVVSRIVGPAVSRDDARLLRLLGVGPRPLHTLAGLSRTSLAVCVRGEKGTGKKRVAEAIHRLGGGGPFLSLKAPTRGSYPWDVEAGGIPGTLYLALGDEWTPDEVIRARDRAAVAG